MLYRRPHRPVWLCRYRLLAGHWVRVSTRKRNLEDAVRHVCELYDEARFRERPGLAATTCNFRDTANATLEDLRAALAAGTGPRVFEDYCAPSNATSPPLFGNRMLVRIDYRAVAEYGRWRGESIKRAPARSTVLTYAAAWSRVQQIVI